MIPSSKRALFGLPSPAACRPAPDGPCVVVKGGGDLGSGCIARLYRAGFRVLVTERAQPLAIRRPVAFASAIGSGPIAIEGIPAWQATGDDQIQAAWQEGVIPVIVDPAAQAVADWQPAALVDAIMAKNNLGTRRADAPVVVALGPGFVAGQDCHAVVETRRGHNLGRVYYAGTAEADTGIPGPIGGADARRVLRAPEAGVFRAERQIGDQVTAGQVIAHIDHWPVRAEVDGVVRGLLADGLAVTAGLKIGDIDPRGLVEHCFTISDKAWAIGGGVLEAILCLSR